MDICSLNFTVTLPDVAEDCSLSNKGILKMLQEIACIHSKYGGISVNSSKVNGLAWVILNWKLKVFSRPSWNSVLKVNTWSRKHTHAFFYRDFEVFDENDNLVAVATSKWILFDLKSNSIAKMTDELASKYISVDKAVFNEPMVEKLKEPEGSKFVYNYTIQKRDIDTNHHVNNLNYLDFAYEALPDDVYCNYNFNNIEIMYKHEAKLGDSLNLFYSISDDNSIFVSIKNKEDNKLHCIVQFY